jgi:ABC-type transport system involved in multi-copper enzyme maturation permease subunit
MNARGALAGWFPVAIKEARATLLSPRFIIIAALLALAVLAGTYSITPGAGIGGTDNVAYGFTYWPDLNRSRPAMEMLVTSPGGEPLSGIEVQLAEMSGPDRQILETKGTDGGWARFENLTERYPDRNLGLFVAGELGPPDASVVTQTNLTNVPRPYEGLLRARLVSFGVSDRQVLSLVFVDSRGSPVEGADSFVVISDRPLDPQEVPPGGWSLYRNGTTGNNGYFQRADPLAPGGYVVRAARGSLNATAFVSFFGNPDPLNRGPDGVLAFVGATFLSFLLPVVALVLGYDAIARERSEGSLDLLLAKPVSRVGVALGKLIGAFGSAALPVAIVLIGSALVIWIQSGQAPTASFIAIFVGIALFILLVYTLIFLAISALVKNLGSALLVSILVVFVFTFFWGLVSALTAGLLAQPGSSRWFEIRVASSLFTPTGVYQQWLTVSAPALAGGFFGPIGGTGLLLPAWWTLTAALAWTAGPLVLFLWTAKYRLGEA